MRYLEPDRRTLPPDVSVFFVDQPRGPSERAKVSRRSRRRPNLVGARWRIVLLASIGVALVLGAVARSAPHRALSFAATKSYRTDGEGDLAMADLNGDGRPDLVSLVDTLSVLLNRGDGRFAPRRHYATGGAASLAIRDLNGDGKSDLATANWNHTVSVLLNRGDGRFAPRRDYATGAGTGELAVADLNGDGKPDLVTANSDAGTISVLLNRGDGRFAPRSDYATGADLGYATLRVADLNGDAEPDLVSASKRGDTASVLLNQGDGTFGAKHDYSTSGPGLSSVTLADLNGDHKPDLATANFEAHTVSVLLNRGDGSFAPRRDYATGAGTGELAVADLNGDKKPDLVTPNNVNTVSVLLNRGDGRFAPRRHYATGAGPGSLTLADLNGDGKPDLTSVNAGPDTFSVLLNRGNGSFATRRDYPTGVFADDLEIADLNNDGKPDLITSYDYRSPDSNTISVLLNRGNGGFLPRADYRTGGSVLPIAIADLNGDRRPDLVTEDGDSVFVLINKPGLCNVQRVTGMVLAAAKRKLARVNCRVGKVISYSTRVRRGRVISQKPKFGAVRLKGAKVNLVISRGRKR